MVAVRVTSGGERVFLAGHGLAVSSDFKLDESIYIVAKGVDATLEQMAAGCQSFHEYSTVVLMRPFMSFGLMIEEATDPKSRAIKAWNSLWLFYLLSLACRTPVAPLYSQSDGVDPVFALTNRNILTSKLADVHMATEAELEWAVTQLANFWSISSTEPFTAAMRCYGNAHYLPDLEPRVMLLWAGIEGLVGANSELRHRIAQNAAILLGGDTDAPCDLRIRAKRL